MLCIPKNISKNLLAAAKKGEFTVESLIEMGPEKRNKLFNKYADKGNAQSINAMFEQALASEQQGALAKWAESAFGQNRKENPKYKNVMAKVAELKDMGVLTPSESENYYHDLVAEKLGVSVSAEEAQQISERADRLEELSQKEGGNDFGLPSIEYFKARNEMMDYLNSVEPTSNLKILSHTIARGNMLASFKSPLTNIIGNSVMGIQQAFERRIASGRVSGTNGKFATEYVKFANKIFSESGFDVTRMTHLDDTQKTLGEQNISSQGKGAIRAVGRVYEDVIFKKLMSAPDVAFSAVHFADSANIATTKIANSEGLKGEKAKARALEIFKDATSLNPKSDEGILVREQAIADASYATFQNDSYYSTLALGIRNGLNKMSGNVRLGDQLMPFVKTPANVVGAGLDAAGVGALRAFYELPSAIKSAKAGDMAPMRSVTRGLVRTGLGLTFAAVLSSLFSPDDFIGEYPTSAKERQLMELENASPNSVKIGDKWYSLDYFGPVAAPFIGMMYAKKYGHGTVSTVYQYGKGVAAQAAKLPGFTELNDLLTDLNSAKKVDNPTKDKSPKDVAANLLKTGVTTVADFLAARVIPALVYDFGKATDDYERQTDPEDPSQKFSSKIPGLREDLPAKTDAFGKKIETESALSTLLFGARVKTARSNAAINELSRLEKSGNLPSITDVETSSDRVKQYKEQVSEAKFRSVIDGFGQAFGREIEHLTQTGGYKNASDEEKAAMINKKKEDLLDSALSKGGYKKPKKKK